VTVVIATLPGVELVLTPLVAAFGARTLIRSTSVSTM
jgi:hypothetical protein